MGASSSSLTIESLSENREDLIAELKQKCKIILKENSGNRAVKYALLYLDSEEGKALSDEGEFEHCFNVIND